MNRNSLVIAIICGLILPITAMAYSDWHTATAQPPGDNPDGPVWLQTGVPTPQDGLIDISGGTMNDIYMCEGCAIRSDKTGGSSYINMGNWGSGANGFNFNVIGNLTIKGFGGPPDRGTATTYELCLNNASVPGTDCRNTWPDSGDMTDIWVNTTGDGMTGLLSIFTAGGPGLVVYAESTGGEFEATAATGLGVHGVGNRAGGYFVDKDGTGSAYVGTDSMGIKGSGSAAGGYFSDSNNSGEAWVGYANYGTYARGTTAGAYLFDEDNTGRAYVGYGNEGIRGYGTSMGGRFFDSNGTSEGRAAWGGYGIWGLGDTMGGRFMDKNQSGYSYVGYGDTGIRSYGNTYGGRFQDIDTAKYALLGYGDKSFYGVGNMYNSGRLGIGVESPSAQIHIDPTKDTATAAIYIAPDAGTNVGLEANYQTWGVIGRGYSGGVYGSSDNGVGVTADTYDGTGLKVTARSNSAEHGIYVEGGFDQPGLYIGKGSTANWPDYGIDANAWIRGGAFTNGFAAGNRAYIATQTYGIESYGTVAGGLFKDATESGVALLGNGGTGIWSRGDTHGGYFEDGNNTGVARVAYGNEGIRAEGSSMGGRFIDIDGTSYAYLGYAGYGIYSSGDTMGGYFRDANNSGYGYIGYGDTGVRAYGNTYGGYFRDIDNSTYGIIGYGGRSFYGYGDMYNSGRVGIGISSPGSKLHTYDTSCGAGCVLSRFQGTALVDIYGDGWIVIEGNARKPGGGAWEVPSDIRLKDVGGSFDRGLDALMELNPFEYSYKENIPHGYDSSISYIGISAQEVQKVIPEAVSLDENGYLNVSTDPIIWTMLNSIKELKAENDELMSRVEVLENK